MHYGNVVNMPNLGDEACETYHYNFTKWCTGCLGTLLFHGPLGINVEYRLNASEIVMVNLLSAVSLHMSSKQK